MCRSRQNKQRPLKATQHNRQENKYQCVSLRHNVFSNRLYRLHCSAVQYNTEHSSWGKMEHHHNNHASLRRHEDFFNATAVRSPHLHTSRMPRTPSWQSKQATGKVCQRAVNKQSAFYQRNYVKFSLFGCNKNQFLAGKNSVFLVLSTSSSPSFVPAWALAGIWWDQYKCSSSSSQQLVPSARHSHSAHSECPKKTGSWTTYNLRGG